MNLRVNPGDRPSRLELGRRLCGESPGAVDPAFAEAVAQTIPEPFDLVALVARSERLVDPTPAAPARRHPWWGWAPLLLGAAAAVFLVVSPPDAGRTKGGDTDLGFLVLKDGQPLLGDPTALYRAGDRLQFNYLAGGHDHLVLLSTDGTGAATVYFPAEGEEPVPVFPSGRHVLDASIILDDAPGPEVFVAFFGDWTVSEATERVEAAWRAGGADAVSRLDVSDPSIATLLLEKE